MQSLASILIKTPESSNQGLTDYYKLHGKCVGHVEGKLCIIFGPPEAGQDIPGVGQTKFYA